MITLTEQEIMYAIEQVIRRINASDSPRHHYQVKIHARREPIEATVTITKHDPDVPTLTDEVVERLR